MESEDPHKRSTGHRQYVQTKALQGMGYFSVAWTGIRGVVFLGVGLILLWNSFRVEEALKTIVAFFGIALSLVSIGMIGYAVNLWREMKVPNPAAKPMSDVEE